MVLLILKGILKGILKSTPCWHDNITSLVQLLVEQQFPFTFQINQKKKKKRRGSRTKVEAEQNSTTQSLSSIQTISNLRSIEAQGTLLTAPSTAPPQRLTPSLLLSLFPQPPLRPRKPEPELEPSDSPKELDIRHASKLKGVEARKWVARQLMLPEWMIDVPDQLPQQGSDVLWCRAMERQWVG